MEVVPKEVAFAAAKLDAFHRNRYRIETTGATTAGPSSIVTINLPDAAVLDLRTFRVHMDVLMTAAAGATGQVRAKCPHASDLIANMEVYMGGGPTPAGGYPRLKCHTHTRTCLLYTSPSPRDS